MEKNILHNITNELKAILPNAPISQMLELYIDFAQMETEVEQGVKADWIDNVMAFYSLSDSMRSSHKYLLNAESFLKKVLYTIDEQKYQNFTTSIKSGLYYVFDELGLLGYFPPNPRLDTMDVESINDPVCKAIAMAYQLRNKSSHTSEDWTLSQMIANVNAVMIATLKAVWDNRQTIQRRVSSTANNGQYKIKDLLEKSVKEYNRKLASGFKYVPLLWESDSGSQSKKMLLEEMLSNKHILLSGDAGCGKSTALDYLEYQASKKYISGETGVIPVKLAMIDENPSCKLEEMICHKLNIPADHCESLLLKNNILLLVDGLNELTTDAECKRQFVISLEQFVARYSELNVIVTDRRYSPFPIRLEKTYHLKPMTKEDIIHYAKTRAECTNEVLSLLTKLLDKPAFATLEITPLLINQLLLVLNAKKELPEDHTELIGIYLEALQTREYQEKRDLNAAPGKFDLFLMKLAIEMPEEGNCSITQAMRSCAELAKEFSIQIQSDVCINLAVQLGILQQSGGYVSFVLDEYRAYYFLKAMDVL